MEELLIGSRSKNIRMPFFTYLEHLHFTGVLPSYSSDLRNVDYGSSFHAHIGAKSLNAFKLGPIDLDYMHRAFSDINEIRLDANCSASLLDCSEEDMMRALLLLVYCSCSSLRSLPHDESSNSFSVYEAASASMTDLQMAVALRLLLWSEYAFFNEFLIEGKHRDDDNLMQLQLNREKSFSKQYIKDLLKNNLIHPANPLLCSTISGDLWNLMEKSSCLPYFSQVKEALSFCCSSMDRLIECYLKGAYSRIATGIPLKVVSCRDRSGMKWDIADPIHSVLIAFALAEDARSISPHFGLETCIISTHQSYPAGKRKNMLAL
jgi:hypothetical protein